MMVKALTVRVRPTRRCMALGEKKKREKMIKTVAKKKVVRLKLRGMVSFLVMRLWMERVMMARSEMTTRRVILLRLKKSAVIVRKKRGVKKPARGKIRFRIKAIDSLYIRWTNEKRGVSLGLDLFRG
jgi:hypothetical protein